MSLVVNLPAVVATLPQSVLDAINAGVLIVTMDCTAAELPGDLVRLDATTDNLVVRATDNIVNRPVIGWLKDKFSDVSCRVVTKGIIPVTEPVGRLYLSTSGTFTDTPPIGYQQCLGYSFGNGKLMFDPELKLTLKT